MLVDALPAHTAFLMPIAPQLQRFVDDELTRAPALIERCQAGVLTLLRDGKNSGLLASERAHHFALVEVLQRQADSYQRSFVESLRKRVLDELEQQQGAPAVDAGFGLAGLELMDESRVEIDIEISRAMQLIDTTAEWELRELQTFTSTLIGQTHVSAESNPFRPLVYASALWDAACAITPTQAQRATLLRISAGVAAGLLKNAWAAASTRLEAQGVEPGVYRTVLLASGSVPGRPAAPMAAQAPTAIAALLADLPNTAPRGSASGARASQVDLEPDSGTLGAEFEQALKRLDEALQHLPVSTPNAPNAPAQGEEAVAAAKRLNTHRAAVVASAGVSNERRIIELLTRLFDTLLSDSQLPAAFHAPVARLQVPAMRLALRDGDLLASTQHPLWQMLDRIGLLGTARPNPTDPRALALLAHCGTLSDELARLGAPDSTACRRALDRLDGFIAEQLRAQQNDAQSSVESLQFGERREKLEQTLTQRLADQLAPMKISPLIRRFMTGTWAKVLAEAMLRFGDQAEVSRGYVKLVDELSWSLQLPDHPPSRQRLLALLPSLLQRLRAGMALVALPQSEQQSVLDELMTVHTEALRPGTRGPAELTPEQIVQRMRDEVMPEAPVAQAFSDSVIDLASMETVPAELMPNDASARADDPARRVDALRVGDFERLFVQGRWQRVQLLWRSEQGLFFLFAGETAGRTHSITRRALERLAGAGLIQPLQTRPLMQRTIDSLSRELALPS
jgi:hypothetical protein